MKEYHKINSVYKRDQKGNFLIGEWSEPEFEYLKDNPWLWTEKIDGTNIRIMWDGTGAFPQIGGKTDNAQVPTKLLNNLNAEGKITADNLNSVFGDTAVCLYGEGYGAGIQKGGGNYSAEQKFILFDVKIGNWWLKRESVVEIASKLGIEVVPLATEIEVPYGKPENGIATLSDVIEWTARGSIPASKLGGVASVEGWVGTPLVPLFNRKGERIITKIKYKDFSR